MNREFDDAPPPGPERRRSHRAPREGVSVGAAVWYILVVAFVVFMLLMIFTNVWPFGHEVIIQHTWKPVCDNGHGLEFCKP